jgi:hypothetical protein
MAKRREIRNSTAEFLIFQIEGKEHGIEVYYKDKTVWCTQKAMGVLFDCTSDNISVHLQNIYDTDELKKEATTEKISVVRREGNRDVNRTLQFYNLDAIISTRGRRSACPLCAHVGIADEEEDAEPFEEKMARLTSELGDLFAESHRLKAGIREKLAGIGFNVK